MWWAGSWGRCSVTCGENGKQTREVECINMETEELSNDCSNVTKPDTSRPCYGLNRCNTHLIRNTQLSPISNCLKDILSPVVCRRYVKLCDKNFILWKSAATRVTEVK